MILLMSNLKDWMEKSCKKKNDCKSEFGAFMFQTDSDPNSETFGSLKIFKETNEESERFEMVAMIKDFLKKEDKRLDDVNNEVIEEIRSIIEADNAAKEMVQNIMHKGTKHQKEMVLKVRQYG